MNRKKTSKPQIKSVLVTGAAGSVGSLLAGHLADEGYRVIATDLRKPEQPGETTGITWKEADLTDPDQLPPLLEGVDAVIHAAAWVDITVPFERQAPINLYAVIRLFNEARRAGISRFIHFSTGSLYASCNGPIKETSPRHPTSPYEETKLLGEDYLFSQAGQGTSITILRPALIYGPRGKVLVAPAATVPAIIAPLNGIIPRIHGGPRTNLVHSDDVAEAALHLLKRGQTEDIEVFNVACDDVITAGELFETILSVGGIDTAPFSLPFPWKLIKAALPLLSYETPFRILNTLVGLDWRRIVAKNNLVPELTPRVDREATPYLAGNVVFDNTKLKSTGYKFKFNTFLEGWKDTVSWYEENQWIPRRHCSGLTSKCSNISVNTRCEREEVTS